MNKISKRRKSRNPHAGILRSSIFRKQVLPDKKKEEKHKPKPEDYE